VTGVQTCALPIFFALSVIKDQLLMPSGVSRGEFLRFFHVLGLSSFLPMNEPFTPALHEVVEVYEHSPEQQPPCTRFAYWPGLMLGTLVFARAGVSVDCHPSQGLTRSLATQSPLYFENHRFRRATVDLSHGWGSNSRWRTRFHRTYVERDLTIFNWGGKVDLALPPPPRDGDAPLAVRREVLMNRCCVVTAFDEELFPFEDTLAVRRGAREWPVDETRFLAVKEVVGLEPLAPR
jgi:hypothetical protein